MGIIYLGSSKCCHKCPYKKEAQRDYTHAKDHMGIERRLERCGHKSPSAAATRSWRDKDAFSPGAL